MYIIRPGQEWRNRPRKLLKKDLVMVRPREKNERGAHSEKNSRCGHTREKKKRAAKPKV